MKPIHRFIVSASLPEKISKLKELAYNYWWCWNSDARELFNRVDRRLWESVHHNPVLLINKLGQEQLLELSEQTDFVSFLNFVYQSFTDYLKSLTWYDSIGELKNEVLNAADVLNQKPGIIAYFSPEFGINESFPTYSGGLGVLSGDHLKSSSDLGIPLIGVGLLYQMGYFRQHLTQSGWQNEIYNYNDFYSMPIILIKDEKDKPIIIIVDLPHGKAYAQIWKLNIGRVILFLLDTNIEENANEEYRDITDQLYGGTRETRIQQEIMLGIGGIRALAEMNIEPDVIHINEGHASFALLERTYLFMKKYNLDFRTAKQITRSSSVFTTHTPVAAGNEVFRLERIENYFHNYYNCLGLSKEDFISLGQEEKYNPNEKFSMTVLGLRLSAYHNGVSKLHGSVARRMWKKIWRAFPEDEIPIRSITNGIHTLSWVAREFAELYDRYLSPSWRTDTDNQEIWKNVDNIPGEELYREKQRRRVRLVLFAREYLKSKQKQFLPPEQISKINEYLDTQALTIGFARRFATYKRAMLLFKDMDKLKTLMLNPEMPVQLIIAGKAHPHDNSGKEVIQAIIHKIRENNLERHIVFLEDYDLVIARLMVKGCDVWLNTPIRPFEACGTSGMKAALNGTLNLSILDGWWDEAYNSKNGFAIGEGEEYTNVEEEEIIESQMLYEVLEQTIVPTFYDRTKTGVPNEWVNYMKESIKSIAPFFSTQRMVKEYTKTFYLPAMKNFKTLSANNGENAKILKEWKMSIKKQWMDIEVINVTIKENEIAYIGKPIYVNAILTLGKLRPDDVTVQVFYGSIDPHGEMFATSYANLNLQKSDGEYHYYEGEYYCSGTGMQGFTLRVIPKHPLLTDHTELYLCKWAK